MKLRIILPLVIGLFCSLSTFAQKNDEALFTISGTPVTVGEFKYIYEKNNATDKNLYNEKSVREYLNLYINFKLKVREAHDEGLDTLQKFKNEYTKYRGQLAQPYLTDRDVSSKLLDEAYDRLKYELRASHILLTVAPDASPKDTMEAYKLALRLRDSIMKGADFEKVARKFSKDPSVQNNGGDLGYFTAFNMIYPFESAAFNLGDSGKISMPIRTNFGYHVIKITGKRPYRGEIQVRHILINSMNTDAPEKKAIAKNKIDSIYSQLKSGASFSDLAKHYSDHTQSKNNGGELPKFKSLDQPFPESFKDHAFALKHNGDYSQPFHSEIGWHIILREDLKPLPSRKEMEEVLKQKVSRDSRSEKSRDAALNRFKKELKFKEKGNAISKFQSVVDTSLLHGNWKGSPKAGTKTMFSFAKKDYTQKDFADYLIKVEAPDRFSDLKFALREYLTVYENAMVNAYVDQNLENTHPEFKNVANEYKEGILLFDITDKMVWGKAMTDTTGLKKYFEDNRSKYRWKQRANAAIFDLRDASAVAAFKKDLNTKTSDAIANDYIKKDPLSLNYKESTFEKGENHILDTVPWTVGVHDIGMVNGRYYIVKINKVIAPEEKQLSEVKGMVIADYQDYLEKQWLNTLKQKYPVTINEPAVSAMIKK